MEHNVEGGSDGVSYGDDGGFQCYSFDIREVRWSFQRG